VYVWNTKGIADYHAEADRLRTLSHVVGAAPAILGQGLLTAARETAPVQIKGIDPDMEPEVTDLRSAMIRGRLTDVVAPVDGLGGILVGKDLATKLGLDIGDSVSLVTPAGTLTPGGEMFIPRRLKIVGIFSLGLYEFDSTYGYVSLPTAMRLFRKDQADLIQLRLDDVYAAPSVTLAVSRLGGSYLAEDWSTMNKSLFSALWLEKMAISLTIGLIVMVAALNIVASLILLVMEKHRDIAILKTMGASARSVTIVFMLQGLLIGMVGTSVGAGLGFAASYVLDRYKLIRVPVDVYQVSHVPFTVLPLDFALVVMAAVLICFIATIYPSRQAAKLDPAQALRYE
jgi:lipoprotein-releasing system permease protein